VDEGGDDAHPERLQAMHEDSAADPEHRCRAHHGEHRHQHRHGAHQSASDGGAGTSFSVNTALAEPDVQRKLNAMGMTLVGSSPEQMVQEIRTETAKLRQIATAIPGGVN
jgi:hypothetical protein